MKNINQKWIDVIGKAVEVNKQEDEATQGNLPVDDAPVEEKKTNVSEVKIAMSDKEEVITKIVSQLQPDGDRGHTGWLKRKLDIRRAGNHRALFFALMYLLLSCWNTYARINNHEPSYWAPIVGALLTFMSGNPDAGLFN